MDSDQPALEWRAVRAARACAGRLGITHAFSEGKQREHLNGGSVSNLLE